MNKVSLSTIGVEAIIQEALSWQGTPYKHQASCKGAGCDCLGLIRGVYSHFWPEPERPGAYSPDWAEAGGADRLVKAAQQYLIPVPIHERQPGDILLFRYRSNFPAKHAGILIEPDRFLHAQHGATVSLVSLSGWWQRHIACVYSFPITRN